MSNGWHEVYRDDDPFDPELLVPPPFCFQTPGDPAWHVTATKNGETMPGRFRPAKGETWRPACGDREVPVQGIPVQRQPTCPGCREAVVDAQNLKTVDGIMQR